MKAIFGRGLIIFLPIVLSIYLLIAVFSAVENFFREIYFFLNPQGHYFMGAGFLAASLLVFATGVFFHFSFTNGIKHLLELPFKKIPVLKTLYNTLVDIFDYFAGSKMNNAGSVVLVRFPGLDMDLLGFLTQQESSKLPPDVGADKVAVYLPLSYQIGGHTVFIPRSWVRPIDMKFEHALRSIITGWIMDK